MDSKSFNKMIIVVAFAMLAWTGPSRAETAATSGITDPIALPPFDRAAAACKAPVDLDRRLIFFQDNDRQFIQGVRFGLEQAATTRGLNFSVELAGNDAAKMAAGVDAAVTTRVGALVAAPVDAIGLAPSLEKAINAGAYVGTVVPPPAVTTTAPEP